MSHYATITPTRLGYDATFHERQTIAIADEVRSVSWDLVGMRRWRWTRTGIEKAAARVIRRLDTRAARHAARYNFTPKADA